MSTAISTFFNLSNQGFFKCSQRLVLFALVVWGGGPEKEIHGRSYFSCQLALLIPISIYLLMRHPVHSVSPKSVYTFLKPRSSQSSL